MEKKPVIIREVWAENLKFEVAQIRQAIPRYPIAAMDTEFPGTIFVPNVEKQFLSKMHVSDNYRIMKANVDALNIIQLGLSLSDSQGNLPDFGTHVSYVWEFNFRDFEIERDSQNPDSIQLLKKQGINFEKNKEKGIDSRDFARIILKSGLVLNHSSVTWVTFHGAYDFGLLIKILIRRDLPSNIFGFMNLVNYFFGVGVYDMKHMMNFFHGLNGGLERVAKILGVDRVAGKSHQAGSDSLLTIQTFLKFRNVFFNGPKQELVVHLNRCRGVLHGLEVTVPKPIVWVRSCRIPMGFVVVGS